MIDINRTILVLLTTTKPISNTLWETTHSQTLI